MKKPPRMTYGEPEAPERPTHAPPPPGLASTPKAQGIASDLRELAWCIEGKRAKRLLIKSAMEIERLQADLRKIHKPRKI